MTDVKTKKKKRFHKENASRTDKKIDERSLEERLKELQAHINSKRC